MLKLCGIPRQMLPEIRCSSEVYGQALIDAVRGVPIAGVLSDQQAELFGQTCSKPGEPKNTYGTGNFLLMNTERELMQSRYGLITTVASKLGTQPANCALEGSTAITRALVQSLRDDLGLFAKSSDIESLARIVKDNVAPTSSLRSRACTHLYWKANARGVIAGLTHYANKGHLARAALEATAFQTREVVEAMGRDSGIALDVLRTDGGMVQDDLLMQFRADILIAKLSDPWFRRRPRWDSAMRRVWPSASSRIWMSCGPTGPLITPGNGIGQKSPRARSRKLRFLDRE